MQNIILLHIADLFQTRGVHVESDWSQSFYSPAANSARSTSVVKVSRARAHKHSYILLLNALSMCARVANHIPIQPTSLNDKSDTESLCFIPKPSTCRKLKTMSRDVVNGAAWHTDSERAVFVYRCGIVMTWDIAMGRAIQMTEHRFPMSVAVGPYLEKMLVAVSGMDNVVTLYDMSDHNADCSVSTILPQPGGDGHEGMIHRIAFTSRKSLVTGSGDHTVRLWDVESGKSMNVFRAHKSDCVALEVFPRSAEDPLIASGSLDATVCMWDARTDKPSQVLEAASEVTSISFFPSGRALATADVTGAVQIFDVRSSLPMVSLSSASTACTGIEWSLSGRALYTSHECGSFQVWEPFGSCQFLD